MNLPTVPSAFSAWRRLLVVIAVSLCAPLLAPRAMAQVFDATQLGQARIQLGPGWLVHAGDDPAYAQPGFDDSHWMPFNATGSLHDLFPHSQPPVVWYRLHVKIPPGQKNLALYEYMISSAIEAQNAHGELFGFDRGKAFSTRPAADIAAAAKQFGQLDDITVLSLTFASAAVSHA